MQVRRGQRTDRRRVEPERCLVKGDAHDVTALVHAAEKGDEAAWNELIDRYAPLVMSVLARYRMFHGDAEDVSQIVWLRLVEHLGQLREPRALPMWIITTTRNECVRLARANRRTETVDPLTDMAAAAAVDERAVDERMLRAERSEALFEALAELSDEHRALLLLLIEDPPLPYAEIATRLDMPIGGIGPTRARALRKLRSSPALVAFESDRGSG
jgi:RNA polymerase sigma factor (sigma-70 family)